ncbi:FG-GAP-like repeat-containing protein [Streptomyces sp. NPDC003016]
MRNRKTLSAAILCSAGVLAVSALTAGTASAAPAHLKGDFNGDGYADLAVGVPKATVGGKAKAGYVNVVWGSANGPAKSTVISQNTAGVPGAAEADDRFGSQLVTDDVNGDGYADLVVSAPQESLSDISSHRHGVITVLPGSATGFGTAFTAARGSHENAYIGGSLSTGDYDNDGDRDLAYQSSNEESAGVLWQPGPTVPNPAAPARSIVSYQFSGPTALATGDFDGNGTDDLAVTYSGQEIRGTDVYAWEQGAPVRDWSTPDYAASLAVADFGKDGADDLVLGGVRANPEAEETYCPQAVGGTVRTVDGKPGTGLGSAHVCLNQDTPGVPGTGESGDDFGAAVAAGDVNGDGYPELVVGVGQEALGSKAAAGSVSVLTGSARGVDGGSGGHAFHQDTAGIPGAAEAGDRFGAAVALTDLSGDGRADLAAGTPGENSSTGGVWYVPSPATATPAGARALTPNSLGLTGAVEHGRVFVR